MKTAFNGIIIVIPTRNRAAVAEAAIQSALQHEAVEVSVLVSDNSTSEEELKRLANFCSSLGDRRLTYVRPPQSLRMAPHWDWALHQALELYSYNHVTFLTDRMMFKPGARAKVAAIASEYPDSIISYMHDRVADNQLPIRVDQHPWTAKLYRASAKHLLQLSSHSILHEMLPRMLNAVVPREHLARLAQRFGKFFDSHSPDFNFCYRSLELVESIMFYDEALLIHYALNRSNGAAATSGENNNEDREDFVSGVMGQAGYFAVPIPEILTPRNSIAHEYCVTRNETKSQKFPLLNEKQYLEALASELPEITNLEVKAETERRLLSNGWKKPTRSAALARRLSPTRVANKVAREFRAIRSNLSAFENGVGSAVPEFASLEAALEFALRSPRTRIKAQPELEKTFGLVPVSLAD